VHHAAVDPSSIQQTFQLGRYLLHSSSNVVVPNLAGLWADGPTSAWSGDYHFNINLQQVYWGADVTGMGSHLRPLGRFMARLAKKGSTTAQNMYGITGNGWVAHGFTDNSLSGGLRGEPYWSLCVTCGAWMALSMWEHLLFTPTSEWVSETNLMSSVLLLLRGAAEFFTEYMFIAEDGITHHTGPTTSPENSYILMHVNASTNSVCMVGAAAPQASHLAMSPALDASVLRQLASAFSILSEWAADMLPLSQYSEAQRAMDRVTAAKLGANVASMPGGGLPTVGLAGVILEYPAPLSDAAVHAESRESQGQSGVMTVTEELDAGHRHFSSMHWLYPSSTLPLSGHGGQILLEAAKTTLDRKVAAGGGHTAWSAGWEIALRARLRDVTGASAALTRLLRRYTTPNGLALHPPLDPVRFTSLTVKHGHMGSDWSHDKLSERKKVSTKSLNCKTCFTERAPRAQGLSFGALKTRRGLETSREDKFQLDGHGALVGAVSELLLQSHLPGHLLLLPGINALPSDPGRRSGGSFSGLRARGDVTVSAAWSSARIEGKGTEKKGRVGKKNPTTSHTTHLLGATLAFNSAHPWLHSAHWKEGPHPGFWDISSTRNNGGNASDLPVIMVVVAPARHLFIERSMCAEHLSLDDYSHLERGDDHVNLPVSLTEDLVPIFIQVHSFPCTVSLCPSRSTCSSELAAELAIADPGPL
jgi:alpha-L-fucosidase 2